MGIPDETVDKQVPDQPHGSPAPAPQAGPAEKALILVVEDNPEMTALLVKALGRHYRVETAIDGEQGLAKALAIHPDLIVTDVMMPRMSGDKMVEALRRHPEMTDVPIVVLTAMADDKLRIGMLKDGAQDFIAKPFSVGELLARVDRLVSDRKRMAGMQARLAAIVEASDDAIVGETPAGIITSWNSGAEKLFGYGAPEAVGEPMLMLFPPDRKHEEQDLLLRIECGESVRNLDTVRIGKNGKPIDVSVTISPIKDGLGRIIGASSISRDISDRKRAEAALRESELFYRQTLESIPGMVFTTRPDGYCDYQSQQWVDYSGVPMSEHLGDGWNRLLHPEDQPRALAAWMAAVEGKAPYDLEYRVRRHDGTYEWFRVIGRPIRDAKGRIVRWFGAAMNVEDLKRAEQALQRLNETLEQQVAERTELAEARARQLQALAVELIEAEERERRRIAQILHDDLQQILAAARMQVEAVCRSQPAEPILAGVERMLAESIGKSRRLSHELSPEVLYHSGLSAALKWLVRQIENQFGLTVALTADPAQPFESAPLKVFFFRAVQELLFNVVKHAGVKSARVLLSASEGSLDITVSDQGKGFDPAILDGGAGSTGFGLLSLGERARHIGGRLDIDSAPGRGSRLTLSIPLSLIKADEPQAPAAHRQASAPDNNKTPTRTGGTRILLVDDHQVMRQGLIRLMNGQPAIQVVGEAANGLEAIEQVRQLQPDVVVMDVSMPQMDGIEATRRIKSRWPAVRVIGLSMHEDEQLAQTMREAGAEAFLSKTTSSASLLETIYKVAGPLPARQPVEREL